MEAVKKVRKSKVAKEVKKSVKVEAPVKAVKKEKATKVAKISHAAMLERVMLIASNHGVKKYMITPEWIQRKLRGRSYYGVILTKEFSKAYFKESSDARMAEAVISGDPLKFYFDYCSK